MDFEVDRTFKSLKVTVNMFSLPLTTHCYLIQPISACMDFKVMLSVSVKFITG